jgi:hypothetical protein
MYKKKVVTYEPIEIDRNELVTKAEAARMTGMTLQGINSAVARGGFTEIVDEEAPYHGRYLLLKEEVYKYMRDNGRKLGNS